MLILFQLGPQGTAKHLLLMRRRNILLFLQPLWKMLQVLDCPAHTGQLELPQAQLLRNSPTGAVSQHCSIPVSHKQNESDKITLFTVHHQQFYCDMVTDAPPLKNTCWIYIDTLWFVSLDQIQNCCKQADLRYIILGIDFYFHPIPFWFF